MRYTIEPNIDDSEYLAGKRNTAPEASFEDKQNMGFTKIHKHNYINNFDRRGGAEY